MALNITFDGFCYLNSGSLSNSDVFYQAYFYKGGTGSSPSKWNTIRTVESSGYYNFNLGDGDFLTQDGTALTGATVVVAFWKNGDRTGNDCSILEEWGAFEVVLDGSDTYTNPTQIRPNILPDLVWNMTSTALVNQTVNTTNNSEDEHTWSWMGTTMAHWYTRYGQTIHSVNRVIRTDYDWDDGNQDNNLAGAAVSSHFWTAPGIYDVEIVIYDVCMDTVTGTKQIIITNNPPVPDIIMIPSNPDPDTPVSFRWDGTDVDNTISGIDWVIHDSGAYGNTDTTTNYEPRDDVIPHSSGAGTDWYGHSPTSGAFTNPGSHLVEITYYWWDGFTMQTGTYSETFNQRRFSGPTVDFDQDPAQAVVGDPVEFTNTSTDSESRVGKGTPDGPEYDWRWTDNATVEYENDKPFSYKLTKTPSSTACEVRLCANWHDGWDNKQTCVEKDVVFGTVVTITEIECYYGLHIDGTSGDGSVTGYNWEVYRSTSSDIAGPYDLVWSSPTSMSERDKTICFTEQNYFRIIGYVYGTGATTSDDEYLYVEEVCASGTGAVEYRYVAVCSPDMTAEEIGRKTTTARQLDKIYTGTTADVPKIPKTFGDENKPRMGGKDNTIKPPRMSGTPLGRPRFPGPSEL